jgi:hypothetical protein
MVIRATGAPAEQVLDAGQGPAGRRHGKLLPGDLDSCAL